jgi:hypothetical protein
MPQADTRFLSRVLLGNATFGLLSGLACLLWARPLANTLGIEPPLILSILGVALLLFAAELAWIATRMPDSRRIVQTIFVLDVAWVIASVLVLLAGWPPFTVTGKWVVAGVADIIAIFALLEYIGLRRLRA